MIDFIDASTGHEGVIGEAIRPREAVEESKAGIGGVGEEKEVQAQERTKQYELRGGMRQRFSCRNFEQFEQENKILQ